MSISTALDRPMSLDEMVKQANRFSCIPAELGDILRVLDEDDLNYAELSEKLAREQSVVAKLLRVANSSFYGNTGEVETLQRAFQILGLANTRAIVATVLVIARMPKDQNSLLDRFAFWQHTLTVAVCAQQLARYAGLSTDRAFIAGLLHDLGKMMLYIYLPEQAREIYEGVQEQDQFGMTHELSLLGFNHAELGAELARSWQFPEGIILPIRWHHEPEQSSDALASVVHVADVIAHLLDLGHTDWHGIPPLNQLAWQQLKLDPTTLEQVIRHTYLRVQMLSTLI
ncbi:HDOD domain-containing protein [Ampullimonas aquatilis]|uniref:HDOD domain-containing protein n=1 Tax=Ampullimonas aquatilis TaxID=1341549 RepID=UPI003C78CE2C